MVTKTIKRIFVILLLAGGLASLSGVDNHSYAINDDYIPESMEQPSFSINDDYIPESEEKTLLYAINDDYIPD